MIPVSKEKITEFGGRVIGYIETDKDGNKQVRDFYGRILGYYNKNDNKTRDFYGRIISDSDTLVGFLYKDMKK